ncbi:MAG TPA: HD domain-containing protein [Actinomycetes bacterium]|nr:HD domain-containing protein [Actinomycetes bacterium]
MDITGVVRPDGAAAEAARLVCAEYSSEALYNHAVRSFVFGAAYAQERSLDFDLELFYVAALLHDFGLTTSFDSHALPFEEAGGHVVRVLTAGLGWSVERRDRAAEVIVLHMRHDVSTGEDVESHLLQVGTSADVSGLRVAEFDPQFVADVLAEYPRLGFAAEFLALVTDQATRKPSSAAAELVASGVAARLASNPLERSSA